MEGGEVALNFRRVVGGNLRGRGLAIRDDTANWASGEFAQANLGDARLSHRLVALARQLACARSYSHLLEKARTGTTDRQNVCASAQMDALAAK